MTGGIRGTGAPREPARGRSAPEPSGGARPPLEDESLFHLGQARRAWRYMGAHAEPAEGTKEERVVFRVWAPRAASAAVVGSFADWETGVQMTRGAREARGARGAAEAWDGTYTLSLPGGMVPDGSLYKYRLETPDGQVFLRSDPYGRAMERPPATATRFLRERSFPWRDEGWLRQRRTRARSGRAYPFNIYELHAGSWKRREDGSPLSYLELADELAPYLKQMGYTHVELLPVMEHPFDGSWGYQVCGYFAPTARYGDPDDFRRFVDAMHNAGVGVILDWVPAHFPKDAHGLRRFDGAPLYEYDDPLREENRGWGTCCFDVGRPEVASFLLSNAYYWIEEFHADGLRLDAVSSMLYLDYDRPDGQWRPNRYGGTENLESVAFLRLLNRSLAEDHPDALTIAEESTVRGHITDFSEQGLGFSYKWNMGWMNDTLRYAREDPLFRKHHHGLILHTFDYAFDERYILPISHDEVVHLKRSFLSKMPGDAKQQFAGARVFAALMMTHPGAKLWFMGCEFGQLSEWDEGRQLDWFLLDSEPHARLQRYFAALNHFYLSRPALWDVDPARPAASFGWLDVYSIDESVYVFRRTARGGQELVVVLSFTPVPRPGYAVNVPAPGLYREVFNSDRAEFGGDGFLNPDPLPARLAEGASVPTLRMTVPPMGCAVLEALPEAPAGPWGAV